MKSIVSLKGYDTSLTLEPSNVESNCGVSVQCQRRDWGATEALLLRDFTFSKRSFVRCAETRLFAASGGNTMSTSLCSPSVPRFILFLLRDAST